LMEFPCLSTFRFQNLVGHRAQSRPSAEAHGFTDSK
jgi:hypothetical protein